MTWVVGLQSLGCAAIFGDVRASYGDVEATEFGIHKIHRLSARTAVGFAGSAKIGFSEVARLQDWASFIGEMAEVSEILDAWYADAYENYNSRYAAEDRDDGCDMVFVGSSAAKLLTAEGREIGPVDPTLGPWHRTHGYEVRFPTPGNAGAVPSLMGNFGAAIGAGAEVDEYVRSIRENVLPAMLKLRDVGSAEESAQVLHVVISAALNAVAERVPTLGVAPMFTGAVFSGDGVLFDSSDHGTLGSGPLPPMAWSNRELNLLQTQYRVPGVGPSAVASRQSVGVGIAHSGVPLPAAFREHRWGGMAAHRGRTFTGHGRTPHSLQFSPGPFTRQFQRIPSHAR